MGFIAYDTGSGLGDWINHSQQVKHEQVQWFDWDVGNRSTVFTISIGMFFWFVCTHGANQVALQRYFTVKTVRAARTSYLVSALASFGIGIILAGVGVSLAYYIQDHPLPASIAMNDSSAALEDESLDEDARSQNRKTLNKAQDSIFPQFIRHYMPSILRGLVVAALFAAAMSTIDSGANSTSTILTVDFFRPLSKVPATEAGELARARMLTAAMGVVVVLYTLGLYHLSKGTNIIDLCQRGFNCFLGPLGATFMLGMFSPPRLVNAHDPRLHSRRNRRGEQQLQHAVFRSAVLHTPDRPRRLGRHDDRRADPVRGDPLASITGTAQMDPQSGPGRRAPGPGRNSGNGTLRNGVLAARPVPPGRQPWPGRPLRRRPARRTPAAAASSVSAGRRQ